MDCDSSKDCLKTVKKKVSKKHLTIANGARKDESTNCLIKK